MSTESRRVLIRGAEARDERKVRAALDRDAAGSATCGPLPSLLFEHFGPTGFVAESGGELAGFLLGFASQTYPGEAHVYAVWVRPDRRRTQLGTALYECFVAAAHEQYCSVVRASAVGTDGRAIAFHQALGFVVEDEDGTRTAPSRMSSARPASRAWIRAPGQRPAHDSPPTGA